MSVKRTTKLYDCLRHMGNLNELAEYKRGYEDGLRANTKAAFGAAKQAADYWKRMYEETFAERTCRITEYNEAPYPVCSECGAVQPEDFTVYYCWNCGRKVEA